MIQAARNDAKNSMSKKRFVSTFAVLLLGVILVFSSFFYIPGYLDLSKRVGVSTQDQRLPKTVEAPGTLDRYKNLFKMRRGYLTRGQHLILTYSLPPDVVVTATIGHCGSPPIIEVFYCNKVNQKEFKVRRGLFGEEKFVITQPGFYYFDETVTKPDGTKTNQHYQITWSRGEGVTKKVSAAANKKGPRLELRRSPDQVY